MFESKSDPLIPLSAFYARLARSVIATMAVVTFSLGLGAVGYHFLGDLPWIDALLNASMILTGMGPVDPMKTSLAKLFATFYSLYSGVAFLTMIAVLVAPLLHRMLHSFHLDDDEAND